MITIYIYFLKITVYNFKIHSIIFLILEISLQPPTLYDLLCFLCNWV